MAKTKRRDIYYRKAKELGYRARSAFKLLQVDEECNIFMTSKGRVQFAVDLCAAPGSWSQVLAEKLNAMKNPSVKIVSVDLQEIAPIQGVTLLQGDITRKEISEEIVRHFQGKHADLVVCDGAPDITGLHFLDEFIQSQLLLAAMGINFMLLRNGGTFVTKIFRGPQRTLFETQLSIFFDSVDCFKPHSSRERSLEHFVVCKNFSLPPRFIPKIIPQLAAIDIPSLLGSNRTIIPYLSCGDLSGFDSCFEDIDDNELRAVIKKSLPSHYDFEIEKTCSKLLTGNYSRVGLQFPEGLVSYSLSISDIFERFAHVETVILGNPVYGACCTDDRTSKALDCDCMIHYGHSQLLTDNHLLIPVIYIGVRVIEKSNLVDKFTCSVKKAFSQEYTIALFSTTQYLDYLEQARDIFTGWFTKVVVPKILPLSSGEVLGCTVPSFNHIQSNTSKISYNSSLDGVDFIFFLGDGRFHFEGIMLANPYIPLYTYDPNTCQLALQNQKSYDVRCVYEKRQDIIKKVTESLSNSNNFFWGIVVSTFGRQGVPHITKRLEKLLTTHKIPYIVVMMSEITPNSLSCFKEIGVWIEVGCPRLAIDWSDDFLVTLLTPYEAEIVLGQTIWNNDNYPMDNFDFHGGSWSNFGLC